MLLLIAALSEEVNGILRAGSYESVPGPEGVVAYRSRNSLEDPALEVAIVLTGTGRERATSATRWAFDTFKPTAMMSLGFGGGTLETLQQGDLVLGTSLYRLDGSPFYWDTEQLGDPLTPDKGLLSAARNAVEVAGIDFEQGPIINLPTVAKTAGMKHWIGKELRGACVDMESFMVCEIASDAGVPFVALRAIVDTVDVDLPDLVGQVDQAPSGGRIVPAIKYLARHPQDVGTLTRLGRAAARARRSLTGFFAEFSAALSAAEGAVSREPARSGQR
jgi:nucleoside phosphorylase